MYDSNQQKCHQNCSNSILDDELMGWNLVCFESLLSNSGKTVQ